MAPTLTTTGISSGANLIARLTPMKRILCLCAVLDPEHETQATTTDGLAVKTTRYNVGMAISDPYLAQASPLTLVKKMELDLLYQSHKKKNSSKFEMQLVKDDFPTNVTDFVDQIEYNDVGAIALALPMSTNMTTAFEQSITGDQKDDNLMPSLIEDDDVLSDVRHYIQDSILKQNYFVDNANTQNKGFAGNGLICHIDERLTWQEAQQMAQEEPEMWEDIPLLYDDGIDEISLKTKSNDLAIHPSVQAAVALNQFLWHHTGGWQNTFG